jgi:hypothetical protein
MDEGSRDAFGPAAELRVKQNQQVIWFSFQESFGEKAPGQQISLHRQC